MRRRHAAIPADADAQIAEYLRTHAVTLCPAAAVAETTATIPPEDIAIHLLRDLDREGAWIAMMKRKRRPCR